MKRIKTFFETKTPEQTFSLFLFVAISSLMFLCAIVRLCGGLWFTADLESVPEPNRAWQEIISEILLIFELLFVYKILCRTSWIICFIISLYEALLGILIGYLTDGNTIITNAFYLVCYLIIPIFFTKKWFSLIENILLYALQFLYALIFLTGRIGGIDVNSGYNFIYSVLGSIDYKLFIVALYLIIKYFGGIKLWKNQKRLIFQTDLRTKA